MGKITVIGNQKLSGAVTVSGSKNAALPIIFATVITRGVSVIKNVPDIADVSVALEIISSFGARVKRCGTELTVDTENMSYVAPRHELYSKIRASTYTIGACLSRFGVAELSAFGGCNFTSRPIDMHISCAEAFGAVMDRSVLRAPMLRCANLVLRTVSVGATVNALLLAAGAPGVSHITPYAKEPHVLNLIEYLRSAGAVIEKGERTLTVRGGALHGGRVTLVGDMIEAGTYLAMSLATDGEVSVRGLPPWQLSSFIWPFLRSGTKINIADGAVSLRGIPNDVPELTAAPYPKFPTDLQPIAAPILALGGGGVIRDKVFPDRFGYLEELSRFGVKYEIINGGARIFPSSLHSATARATDLRAGAAALITALAAQGESCILDSEKVFRGYADIEKKLTSLGAKISFEK